MFRPGAAIARWLGKPELTPVIRAYGVREIVTGVGILGWGSTEGAALEAAQILLDRGLKVSTCYPRVLAPLHLRVARSSQARLYWTIWKRIARKLQPRRILRVVF